jgi:hypothetical protein
MISLRILQISRLSIWKFSFTGWESSSLFTQKKIPLALFPDVGRVLLMYTTVSVILTWGQDFLWMNKLAICVENIPQAAFTATRKMYTIRYM